MGLLKPLPPDSATRGGEPARPRAEMAARDQGTEVASGPWVQPWPGKPWPALREGLCGQGSGGLTGTHVEREQPVSAPGGPPSCCAALSTVGAGRGGPSGSINLNVHNLVK